MPRSSLHHSEQHSSASGEPVRANLSAETGVAQEHLKDIRNAGHDVEPNKFDTARGTGGPARKRRTLRSLRRRRKAKKY